MSLVFRRRSWSESSRRLTIVFVAVLVPAAITLVWLGVRLLEQDRMLYAQREVERLEAAGDAVVRSLAQALAEVEGRLARRETVDGALFLAASAGGLEMRPRTMAAWTPVPARLTELSSRGFEAAERMEFQGAADAALPVYRRLARSSASADVRGAALMRAARVERMQKRTQAAIADYRALSHYEGYALAGAPVDLLARRRICALLLETGDTDEHRREADRLASDFVAGRWSLGRHDWELTAADLAGWSAAPAVSSDARALSIAADDLVNGAWRSGAGGRRVLSPLGVPITLVWRDSAARLTAAAIPPALVRRWVDGVTAHYPDRALAVSVVTESGALMGEAQPVEARRTVRRSAADTGLPWTIALTPGEGWALGDGFAARRRLLMAGLAALGLLLSAGAYLLWRVVQRELAVARLQAEFVSAVSHEFRTPVTSLRHVIELLEEDDELPRERRRLFYEVLGRSTERLDRLVESLLDFGRMEDGRKPYDLRPIDAVGFARAVAAEFARNAGSARHHIAVEADGAPRFVKADETALGHALWNLLDNAVKYSPAGGGISITVSNHELGAAISVRDSGLGVPAREQREIFTKFVRGAEAHRLGIKGTGVGLAIVSHIVHAHGGRIELESEEGKGSTFRLVLPSAA